ncbi:UDP-4-amino-4,6-dideoxy-N-acetyl-beta-L-altrosamine transaminase [Roseimarinus sediminis]|uniref:UDP-4-amino-4, 6-dideoxy-N-acetyl-beta-L-altrosamine transaminase n=1 Tax=Roseimarinus sediminis TaxID=1610899 RepID=UPI003D21A91C
MTNKIIPYGRQNITQEDIDAVVTVLKGDFLTQGPAIAQFEEAFADYIGCKYAVAVSNGTAALHLAAMALDVQPGDKVITTPITFAASANCICYCGGEVHFADIDPLTYCLDIQKVRVLLESHPKGTFKGIIPVDFAGFAVNLEEFRKLADEYGLWMIEDACHAPGGYFVDSKGEKQRCGNGQFAELSVFSFHPVKHIAAGEGGMVTTNDEKLYKKLLSLRTHGITKDAGIFQNTLKTAHGEKLETSNLKTEAFPGWYYEMQDLGYNYRLTDFQAALGHSQLKRADEGLARRKEISKTYLEAFNRKPFIKSQSGIVNGHAYHLYVLEVENRMGLYQHLRAHNIFAQIHYVPVHLMPYYKQFGWKEGDLPQAEAYYSRCISLPMYPTLSNEEQKFVIKSITEFYE